MKNKLLKLLSTITTINIEIIFTKLKKKIILLLILKLIVGVTHTYKGSLSNYLYFYDIALGFNIYLAFLL